MRLPGFQPKAGPAHVSGQFELKESQHLGFKEAAVDCSWPYGALFSARHREAQVRRGERVGIEALSGRDAA